MAESTLAAVGDAACGCGIDAQIENAVLAYGRKCIMFGVQDEKSWLQRRSEDDYDRADPTAKDKARDELMALIRRAMREDGK